MCSEKIRNWNVHPLFVAIIETNDLEKYYYIEMSHRKVPCAARKPFFTINLVDFNI